MLALKHRAPLKPTELAINGVCIVAHLAKVEAPIMSYGQLTYTLTKFIPGVTPPASEGLLRE